MDKKISTLAERQAKNKSKLDNNNQTQQQLSKRQNVAQAYAAGTVERKEDDGTLPLCNKCNAQTGHYKSDCPELKNGNQARGTETRRRVLALVGGEINQDLDDMEDNTNA
ncbi:hypothetical protein Tco_1469433 [Tanacetum coccineum]